MGSIYIKVILFSLITLIVSEISSLILPFMSILVYVSAFVMTVTILLGSFKYIFNSESLLSGRSIYIKVILFSLITLIIGLISSLMISFMSALIYISVFIMTVTVLLGSFRYIFNNNTTKDDNNTNDDINK